MITHESLHTDESPYNQACLQDIQDDINADRDQHRDCKDEHLNAQLAKEQQIILDDIERINDSNEMIENIV
jgi:hypothetical protein